MRTSVSTTSGPNESTSASASSPLGGRLHLVAVALQQRPQHEPDVLLVVDDQDAAHCEKNASPLASATQGMHMASGLQPSTLR